MIGYLKFDNINRLLWTSVFYITSVIFLLLFGAAAKASSSEQDLNVKKLQAKYNFKYIYVIKSVPSKLSKGVFSGIPLSNGLTPVAVGIDLRAVQNSFYKNIDIDNARLFRVFPQKDLEPVKYWFRRETQYRGILEWEVSAGEAACYFFCIPDAVKEKQKTSNVSIPLFMNGGILRSPGAHVFGGTFYPTLYDINNDGKKDLVSGAFHDFIRVYENIAADSKSTPVFSENHSYVLADKDGQKICHKPDIHSWKISAPLFYDFNGDGKLDILWGGANNDQDVWYIENVGTKEEPVYVKKTKLTLICEDGYKSGLYPAIGDLNGDGKLDLLAGPIVPGSTDNRFIYFFEGLSLDPLAFKFKKGKKLENKYGLLRVPGYNQCAVELFDWNNDGLLDLFAASGNKLSYWRNAGTKSKPDFIPEKFPEITIMGRGSLRILREKDDINIVSGSVPFLNKRENPHKFNMIPLKMITPAPVVFGAHGTFKILDWDKDGKLDVIYSDDWGNVMLASGSSNWRKRTNLKAGGKNISLFGCVDPGENNKGYGRMAVGDIDGDSLPDLIVNDELSWRFGYLSFYKNLGNGEFAAERRLDIPPTRIPRYTVGVKGNAAVFDDNTILDFYSYPAEGIFDPEGGCIEFDFSPEKSTSWKDAMCLFHNRSFTLEGNKVAWGDEFKISIEKNGEIVWLAGKSRLKTAARNWREGQWYKCAFTWGKKGMRIEVDNTTVAQNNAKKFQNLPGARVYLGSCQTVQFIQQEREFIPRIGLHKNDYDCFTRTYGAIDEFIIKNSEGNILFQLSFDHNIDGVAPHKKLNVLGGGLDIAYRGAPALADLNNDGLMDLILPVCEKNTRHPVTSNLYWFKNIGCSDSPRFAAGIPLESERRRINAETRCSFCFRDWDNDGDLDLFLLKNQGRVEFYENIGTSQKPEFKFKGIIFKGMWAHEAGIDIADWNGDGQDELILMNGDNGNLSFYNKSFLDRLTPDVIVDEILTRNKEK